MTNDKIYPGQNWKEVSESDSRHSTKSIFHLNDYSLAPVSVHSLKVFSEFADLHIVSTQTQNRLITEMLCHHLVSDHHSSTPQFCPTLPPIKALLSKTFDSKSRQQEKCEHAQSWPSKLSSEPESNCCSEIIVRNFSCYFLAPRR